MQCYQLLAKLAQIEKVLKVKEMIDRLRFLVLLEDLCVPWLIFHRIGERTIHVDCDVLQADGSTRTASITGAYLALMKAVAFWVENGELIQSIITDAVVAVSAGFTAGSPLLDLDYAEDSIIDADYNFVFTESEKIIEIQGAAEKNALSWHEFDQLKNLAIKGATDYFALIAQFQEKKSLAKIANQSDNKKSAGQAPLFSLKNRFVSAV